MGSESFNMSSEFVPYNSTTTNLSKSTGTITLYPMDDPTTRSLLIAAFVTVFISCLIGNLLVITVICRCLKSVTNLYLANLALADLCVGVFCVIPTLSFYLTLRTGWKLGRVMCKLNFFIQQMTNTVSISILTVIALERYSAIISPMKLGLHNKRRFYVTSACTWLFSIVYNILQLVIFDIVEVSGPNGTTVAFCYAAVKINREAYVTVNFVLWYLVPLAVMVFVYTRISVTLWRSGRLLGTPGGSRTSSDRRELTSQRRMPIIHVGNVKCTCYDDFRPSTSSGVSRKSDTVRGETNQTDLKRLSVQCQQNQSFRSSTSLVLEIVQEQRGSRSQLNIKERNEVVCPIHKRKRIHGMAITDTREHNVIKSRRKVIRLLLAVVACFAILVLPYHLRSLYTVWGGKLPRITAPVTNLLMFLNSALNPLVYTLLSQNFRRTLKKGLRSILCYDFLSRCKKQRRQWSMSFNTQNTSQNQL